MMASYEEGIYWFGNISFGICSIIGAIVCIIHSTKIYKDLRCTDKNGEESNDRFYKFLLFSILSSLYFYEIAMIVSCILLLPGIVHNYCHITVRIATLSYILSKMFMYLSFIIRLFMVYNNPIYTHFCNLNILKIISLLMIIWGLIIIILALITSKPYTEHGNHHDYIAYCNPNFNQIAVFLVGLYDFVFSIGTMIAFINPLTKVVRSMLNQDITIEQRDKLDQLIDIGKRYVILTCIASLSTIILLIVLSQGLAPLAPWDYITNMICMILMTKYYNDRTFYQRLCCLAIKCTDWCVWHCCGYTNDTMKLTETVSISK